MKGPLWVHLFYNRRSNYKNTNFCVLTGRLYSEQKMICTGQVYCIWDVHNMKF